MNVIIFLKIGDFSHKWMFWYISISKLMIHIMDFFVNITTNLFIINIILFTIFMKKINDCKLENYILFVKIDLFRLYGLFIKHKSTDL